MKNSLTEEELSKIKAKVLESLHWDRQYVLVKFPFFGNIMLKMNLVPVRDKRIRTASTDGKRIFFDVDFYTRLKNEERIFVLAHEVVHCVLMHLVRRQTRIPELYNIAADMETNRLLKLQTINGDLLSPPNLYYPPKSMEGKSAEVIYEWLVRNKKKKNLANTSCNDNSSNDEQSNDQSDGNEHSSRNQDGNSKKELVGQFDDHDFNDSKKDEKQGKVYDQWGEVGFDKDYCPKVADDFADRMREQIITEMQRCSQMGRGKMPVGIESMLNEFLKPEISWKELMQQFVCSCFGDKRRWLPPARRHVHNEMYFQSRRTEKIKVAVIVDTSGSCWDDLSKFFSEINSLLKSFGDYEVHVIQCDAAVHDIKKYDNSDPFPIDDPTAIDIKGCGGSDFTPACKAIQKNGIENEVDCIIFFTDGEIGFPQYPLSKPSLIILTKDGNQNCCSWGRKIRFKSEQNESL